MTYSIAAFTPRERRLTVGELRAALAGMSDDATVVIYEAETDPQSSLRVLELDHNAARLTVTVDVSPCDYEHDVERDCTCVCDACEACEWS